MTPCELLGVKLYAMLYGFGEHSDDFANMVIKQRQWLESDNVVFENQPVPYNQVIQNEKKETEPKDVKNGRKPEQTEVEDGSSEEDAFLVDGLAPWYTTQKIMREKARMRELGKKKSSKKMSSKKERK